MQTFQDYKEFTGTQAEFIKKAISEYKADDLYKTACIADEYDRQENRTIKEYARYLYTMDGAKVANFTVSNNRIASNFFNRLNTQRCTYSLGNGIEFSDKAIKKNFGDKFDTVMQEAGYYSLIHGVSYLYRGDGFYCFKATEVVPLCDEHSGALCAAIRFWKLAENKPMVVTFYEGDGYTEYQENEEKKLTPQSGKKPYVVKTQYTEAFGLEIVGTENYSRLPLIPLWGSRLKQSTLVGLCSAIDSYDLIRSGFANDLSDCAQIYWLLQNAGGMSDNDLNKFRDRLLLNHIASTSSEDTTVTPYTQEIPYQAREQYLQTIRAEIYEGFGGLDVHTIAAGATNDHIDAAYQPLDENADDFEKQIIECVQAIGELLGLDSKKCIPIFKRNRIANYTQKIDALMQLSQYLDQRTILEKSDIVTVDEVDTIMKRTAAEEQAKVVDLRSELEGIRTETNKTGDLTDGQSA